MVRLAGPEPARDVGRTLRDLPRFTTPSTVAAGFTAALPGITGPWLLAYQAALNAGYPPEAISSWVLAIFAGGGLLSLLLALLYRQPICGAYPIAGSALLVPVLAHYSLPEAAGAFLLSGLLVTLIGVSGLFGWIMEQVPNEVIMGMLAGVLLRFGIGIFDALRDQSLLVGLMLAAYLATVRFLPAVPPVLGSLAVGVATAGLTGQLDPGAVRFGLSQPVLVMPAFTLNAFFSVALPLTLLAIASQNAPGIAILRANGYKPPVNAVTIYSGLGSMLTAPLLGHGLNIAAPMTALCANPSVHPDPRGRYAATVGNGLWFIAFGLVGATAIALIQALPPAFVVVIAGLALFPVLRQAFRLSTGPVRHSAAAGFTLLIAASNLSLLGINAAFWAIVAGLALSRFLRPEPGAP